MAAHYPVGDGKTTTRRQLVPRVAEKIKKIKKFSKKYKKTLDKKTQEWYT